MRDGDSMETTRTGKRENNDAQRNPVGAFKDFMGNKGQFFDPLDAPLQAAIQQAYLDDRREKNPWLVEQSLCALGRMGATKECKRALGDYVSSKFETPKNREKWLENLVAAMEARAGLDGGLKASTYDIPAFALRILGADFSKTKAILGQINSKDDVHNVLSANGVKLPPVTTRARLKPPYDSIGDVSEDFERNVRGARETRE